MNQIAHIEIVTRGVLPLEIMQRWQGINKVAETSLFTTYAVDALSFTLDDTHFLMRFKEGGLVSDFNAIRQHELEQKCEDAWQSEQDMQVLDQAWLDYQKGEIVPTEAERLSLLEPTPFDSGVCKCGEFVAAGKLHEHRCLSWEERERLNDQERLAYCGFEEF